MKARFIDIFFYGLFMDVELLREQGLHPMNARPASAEGFSLWIGQRAAMIPTKGARAYGMLISLTHKEIDQLYASLQEYHPEAILVTMSDGEKAPALCYNLAEIEPGAERNSEYAAKLRALLQKLNFPSEYVASI